MVQDLRALHVHCNTYKQNGGCLVSQVEQEHECPLFGWLCPLKEGNVTSQLPVRTKQQKAIHVLTKIKDNIFSISISSTKLWTHWWCNSHALSPPPPHTHTHTCSPPFFAAAMTGSPHHYHVILMMYKYMYGRVLSLYTHAYKLYSPLVFALLPVLVTWVWICWELSCDTDGVNIQVWHIHTHWHTHTHTHTLTHTTHHQSLLCYLSL